MSTAKRLGDSFERDVVRVLIEHGHPYAERMLRLGAHSDRGDVAGVVGFLFECKNHKEMRYGTWLDEAVAEAARHRPPLLPVVVAKRRGKATEHAYVVLELATFAELIAEQP